MDATLTSQGASGTTLAAGAGGVLDANAVRSVDRAAALLIALGDWDGEVGVTELARRLGLHKSTASRLLSTLQKRGLVAQAHDSGKYRLGLALVRLGAQAERTLRPSDDRTAGGRGRGAVPEGDDHARRARRRHCHDDRLVRRIGHRS